MLPLSLYFYLFYGPLKFLLFGLIAFKGNKLKKHLNRRYPGLQNLQLDQPENEKCDRVPGSWREVHNLEDTQAATGHNTASKEGKKQRNLLNHWVNSPAGAVSWQDRMI